MIRKCTLTYFEKWTKPNKEEIKEAIALTHYSVAELANLLGIHKITVNRWLRGEIAIPYIAWTSICLLAGIGDFIEPVTEVTLIKNKQKYARFYSSAKNKLLEILR